MEEYVDNYAAEAAVLRRKLQSKAEALIILTQELEQCRTERDQFKLLAEQAKSRTLPKKSVDDQVSRGRLSVYNDNYSDSSGKGSSYDHYMEVREQNKTLRYEIQDLKQKLREAYGDIKVLRAGAAEGSRSNNVKDVIPAHQREELVEQLEKMSGRASQLEADLRGVLDEKEELVNERECYRAKVARLNHQINTLLRGDTARLIDIDAILMDNKYLQEQVQQLQAEKELAHQALVKYKSMLEKKRNKGMVKLGTPSSAMVVSHKQVQELLERGAVPNTEASLADVKSLCVALLESLQDKTLALHHQRKANKILASRISELEHRLGANLPVFPSDLLLQGYSAAQQLDKATVEQTLESFEERRENTASDQNGEIIAEISLQGCNNRCDTDSNEDSLPQDLQDLVSKALQEIHLEEAQNR
ncbi:coiled-coil domain-containing protein 149 [Macrosteles quadrilineatus]|uniref:coiled-coil domain-containing protein 149 n=1 Tax=Macrosteles quadrilineatus TaxID=74068 RepID=UPI0023E0B8D3|nr:coiled-coil domain-containing protein 149 [Macrosteles quadrilineatus]